MQLRTPSALDDFLFDLRGYLVLENAIEPELLDALNASFDTFPSLEYGEWWGNAQRRDYNGATGYELHNCIESGEPFERLIDHPSWISYLQHYCGEEDSYVAGLFIDESIASIRRSGGHHPVHSGGYRGALRGAYHYSNGVFRCGQCNILMALTDIGPGDGATSVIAGSHKSNFPHPNAGDYGALDRMDVLEGATEVYLKKGDALLFADGIMHGGSSRTNLEGERRVVIYRYGVSWGVSRYGFAYSQALLDRLTPQRRKSSSQFHHFAQANSLLIHRSPKGCAIAVVAARFQVRLVRWKRAATNGWKDGSINGATVSHYWLRLLGTLSTRGLARA